MCLRQQTRVSALRPSNHRPQMRFDSGDVAA
jgi:hypothetical protein